MTPAHPKRQKTSSNNSHNTSRESGIDSRNTSMEESHHQSKSKKSEMIDEDEESNNNNNNTTIDTFGIDGGDLTDETDSDDDDDDDFDGEESSKLDDLKPGNHIDIQEQLAAAGPAGVAAAAAIATARKRKRPHSFETNPSVRKRQQTRLIRKLRACIDEYTMRVGQQAVVLITMPGKAVHNFKVFGAQPLESVIRTCKNEIMAELDQALLEQAPIQFKEDGDKHQLPPLVIDGIPTPVEKMTQAQLRAFIPLMLKYSTGRGKPGWGKDSTRPPWWPETLPWANVRSDARDDSEKQRISWTTTLRQIVTNCYRYHGRDDLLPTFDENEESAGAANNHQEEQNNNNTNTTTTNNISSSKRASIASHQTRSSLGSRIGLSNQHHHHHYHNRAKDQLDSLNMNQSSNQQQQQQTIYSSPTAYASNFVHTITNSDGTVSLVQVDPANAQILTLPDGTQVRAVRLQTLGGETFTGQQLAEIHEASGIELSAIEAAGGTIETGSGGEAGATSGAQVEGVELDPATATTVTVSEASLGADGQIILTGDDGIQTCYPMSSLVSIPASVYQQFTQGGHQLSIISTDGTSIPTNAITIHSIKEQQGGQQQIDESEVSQEEQQQQQQHQHQQQMVSIEQDQKPIKSGHKNGTNNNNSGNTNNSNTDNNDE